VENGAVRTVDIGIRPRGKSRRLGGFCTFPPLRLDLPKAELSDTLFEKQNKLKLVTHCKVNERHQQVLLREYLAYRILNLLTDKSFNVRLLTVNYIDADRPERPTTRLGFFIEDKSRLARRLDTTLVDTVQVDRSKLAPADASLAELFQFMISNTDFSFTVGPANDKCCHNAVPLAGVGGETIVVPYDFDVSGLVNAPYALPPDGLNQRSVRDRLFRGFCRTPPYLDNAVAAVQAARERIYALVKELQQLDEKNRRQVLRFVDGFYAILDDPEKYQSEIAGACRDAGAG